jgi:hypothetical protein
MQKMSSIATTPHPETHEVQVIRPCDAGEFTRSAGGGPQGNVSSPASVCFMNTRDKWSRSRISLKRQRSGGMLGTFDSLPVEQNTV